VGSIADNIQVPGGINRAVYRGAGMALCVWAIVMAPNVCVGEETPSRPRVDRKEILPPNPETDRLGVLVGVWTVTQNQFDRKGAVTRTIKGSEEIVWIVDHHAIQRTVTTVDGSTTNRAVGSLGWNTAEKKYKGVWFDNYSTCGPTTVTADWNDKEHILTYTLEAQEPGGAKTQYRIVEKFPDSEHREATTYRIEPGGVLVKELVVQYKRTTPCPPGIRVIFEDVKTE
jgi:hypothetical protein